MDQTDRSREQLIEEIAALRQRVQVLEASQARHQQVEQALLASEAHHRRLAAEHALLAEIGRIISASLDISEVYEPFASAVRKLLAFDRMAISLADHERRMITNVYVTGTQISTHQTGYTIPLAGTMTEAVLRNPGGFFLHPRSESEIRQRLPGLLPFFRSGLRSFLAVGLISRDQAIGALLMLSYQPDFFTDDALRLTASVSTQIAGAIASARCYLEHQRAEAALRESETRYRTLAAGIAHEINNPLGAIRLTAEEAQRAATLPQGNAVLEACLADITADIERCSRIVKSVLQFARQATSDKWPADLNQIVQTACNITRHYCHEHGVAVHVETDGELLSPVVNPIEIEQVLVNLIRNAVESHCDRIVIRTGRVEAQVRIEVHDNGNGIDETLLSHIFDPFYTSPDKGSTGLGLSITYGIVSEHGGTIDVTSQPGAGTTARIRLPLVAAAAPG